MTLPAVAAELGLSAVACEAMARITLAVPDGFAREARQFPGKNSSAG